MKSLRHASPAMLLPFSRAHVYVLQQPFLRWNRHTFIVSSLFVSAVLGTFSIGNSLQNLFCSTCVWQVLSPFVTLGIQNPALHEVWSEVSSQRQDCGCFLSVSLLDIILQPLFLLGSLIYCICMCVLSLSFTLFW